MRIHKPRASVAPNTLRSLAIALASPPYGLSKKLNLIQLETACRGRMVPAFYYQPSKNHDPTAGDRLRSRF